MKQWILQNVFRSSGYYKGQYIDFIGLLDELFYYMNFYSTNITNG
jgi:hypothetical protein